MGRQHVAGDICRKIKLKKTSKSGDSEHIAERAEKYVKLFCKKALTKRGVFGIIVKRAGETDKRDRKNSGERTLKTI